MKKILSAFLIAVSLTACSTKVTHVKGAIIPHDELVKDLMEEFYQKIADPDAERIILLSPNHFNYGSHNIQTTDQNIPSLDIGFIQNLATKTPLFIEPKHFETEHGISIHLPYISQYFPNAKIVPIIIKIGIPQTELDALISELNDFDLIIASIDFTHYEREEIALKNDERVLKWLGEWSTGDLPDFSLKSIQKMRINLDEATKDAVAMDSPESFYILTKLMEKDARNFALWKRTSSNSLKRSANSANNTSHIFGTFTLDKKQ